MSCLSLILCFSISFFLMSVDSVKKDQKPSFVSIFDELCFDSLTLNSEQHAKRHYHFGSSYFKKDSETGVTFFKPPGDVFLELNSGVNFQLHLKKDCKRKKGLTYRVVELSNFSVHLSNEGPWITIDDWYPIRRLKLAEYNEKETQFRYMHRQVPKDYRFPFTHAQFVEKVKEVDGCKDSTKACSGFVYQAENYCPDPRYCYTENQKIFQFQRKEGKKWIPFLEVRQTPDLGC